MLTKILNWFESNTVHYSKTNCPTCLSSSFCLRCVSIKGESWINWGLISARLS